MQVYSSDINFAVSFLEHLKSGYNAYTYSVYMCPYKSSTQTNTEPIYHLYMYEY